MRLLVRISIGVSSSGSFVLETEFYDVERVEILRGPQGTLYGRNATGGVLNAVTAKPEPGEFSAKIDLSYGEFNRQKATGHINIPLGENWAARFAGFYLKRDGYSDALLFDGTTQDVDGRDLHAIRASIGGDFNDKASFWALYEDYQEDRHTDPFHEAALHERYAALPVQSGVCALPAFDDWRSWL